MKENQPQKIIDKKFSSVFDTAGYIKQNHINSFIFKSPLEKLLFLEQFAFQDTNICEIKKKN